MNVTVSAIKLIVLDVESHDSYDSALAYLEGLIEKEPKGTVIHLRSKGVITAIGHIDLGKITWINNTGWETEFMLWCLFPEKQRETAAASDAASQRAATKIRALRRRQGFSY